MSACEQTGLTGLETALAEILKAVPAWSRQETVPLSQAQGRVLAEDQYSTVDVPPTDNSAMDGYVLPADLAPGTEGCLPVSQRIAAGDVPQRQKDSHLARIFTGAGIPENGAAVVMQEECSVSPEDGRVCFPAGWKMGQNIRRKGQDVSRGDRVLRAGKRLSAIEIGLLASVGLSRVEVSQKPRVAILCTGDELVEPGDPLLPGKLYNSNRFLLESLVRHTGAEPLVLSQVPDRLDATMAALKQAAAEADVILTTGGVSVGEEDHVRAAIGQLGRMDLWRLALKPGKPFAFGEVAGVPVLGLPGNPSSVLVTFGLMARPFLLKMLGQEAPQIHHRLPFKGSISKPGKRREFLRVRLVPGESGAEMEPHPNQSSGMLSSASWADGLAIVPEHSTVQSGDRLDYLPFQDWLS